MYLPGRVRVAEKLSGQDRDRVLLVVDVRHVPAERRVDVIRKGGVAHARQAEADHAHARARWQVQSEVDCVEERDGRAKGVANDDDG